MDRGLKAVLIGCGVLVGLCGIVVVGFIVYVMSLPESGVKMPNQMDRYALEYIDDHQLLEDGEQLRAYYDVTMGMTGEEAAIVTDRRVIYHAPNGTEAFELARVTDIRRKSDGMGGDDFLIENADGNFIQVNIPMLNGGEYFHKALMAAWKKAGGTEPAATPSVEAMQEQVLEEIGAGSALDE